MEHNQGLWLYSLNCWIKFSFQVEVLTNDGFWTHIQLSKIHRRGFFLTSNINTQTTYPLFKLFLHHKPHLHKPMVLTTFDRVQYINPFECLNYFILFHELDSLSMSARKNAWDFFVAAQEKTEILFVRHFP